MAKHAPGYMTCAHYDHVATAGLTASLLFPSSPFLENSAICCGTSAHMRSLAAAPPIPIVFVALLLPLFVSSSPPSAWAAKEPCSRLSAPLACFSPGAWQHKKYTKMGSIGHSERSSARVRVAAHWVALDLGQIGHL